MHLLEDERKYCLDVCSRIFLQSYAPVNLNIVFLRFSISTISWALGESDLAILALSSLVLPYGWSGTSRLLHAARGGTGCVREGQGQRARGRGDRPRYGRPLFVRGYSPEESARCELCLTRIATGADAVRTASARILHAWFSLRESRYMDVVNTCEQALPLVAAAGRIEARKYLIRVLNHMPGPQLVQRRRRKATYGAAVVTARVEIRDIFEQPRGQRLAAILAEQVKRLRRLGELRCSDKVVEQLQQISPSTIGRLLRREKRARHHERAFLHL
jgi:hypothetical protein